MTSDQLWLLSQRIGIVYHILGSIAFLAIGSVYSIEFFEALKRARRNK